VRGQNAGHPLTIRINEIDYYEMLTFIVLSNDRFVQTASCLVCSIFNRSYCFHLAAEH